MARRGRRRKVGERTGSGRLKRQPIGPSYPREREQHGAIVRESVARQQITRRAEVPQLVDARGEIGSPYLALDELRQLAARGRITREGLAAADAFRRDFRAAYGHRIAASDPARPLVSGKRPAELPDSSLPARLRVERALIRLGGSDSASGSCAWHVVGCDLQLVDWARRWRWGGHAPLRLEEAEAVLVEAVERLAGPDRRDDRWRDAAQ
jgi:hypothetical protein